MTCPACGGSEKWQISPNYWECTSPIYAEVPTGAHPSGIQGPPYRVVSQPCGNRYQAGAALVTPQCAFCTTYSVGWCATCSNAVCGDHSRMRDGSRICRHCIDVVVAAQRAEVERERSAKQQAELDAHADLVAAARTKYGPEERILAELGRIEPLRRTLRSPGVVTLAGIAAVVGIVVFVAYNAAWKTTEEPDSGPYLLAWALITAALWGIPALIVAAMNRARDRHRTRSMRLRSQLGCARPGCKRCATRPRY